MGLHCAKKYLIGLIGSSAFLGMVLGCFIAPVLGDKYGRKKMSLAAQTLALLSLIILLNCKNLSIAIFATGLIGMVKGSKATLGFCYLTEMMQSEWKAKIATLMNFTEALILIIASFFFLFLSIDWRVLCIYTIALNLFSIIGITFLPESPCHSIN